jgi:hypothetical protein
MGDAADRSGVAAAWHPVEQTHNISSSYNGLAQRGLAVEGSPF